MRAIRRCLLSSLCAVGFLHPAVASAAVHQHEALAVSTDWIVIRENIPVSSTDTAACRYPGLDPSEYVGVKIHFIRLSAEAKRGRLVVLPAPDSSYVLYEPKSSGESCTPAADAEQRWRAIAVRAKDLGIELSAKPPVALVLGAPVPAKNCLLIGGTTGAGLPCRRTFKQLLRQVPIQIGVSLLAVPEAPDERTCQFVGQRLVAVMQISGLNFGAMGAVAPGGVLDHYDCRGQQFQPLRLYDLDRFAVILGGFAGANVADRAEHPFLLIFPTRTTP